ncbi:hypothetical protein PATSB16_14730 [Pandoraea thiooxydans]|nr:hypothetical protein PATSB16_14730 [Pandoraea thiooxydans]
MLKKPEITTKFAQFNKKMRCGGEPNGKSARPAARRALLLWKTPGN